MGRGVAGYPGYPGARKKMLFGAIKLSQRREVELSWQFVNVEKEERKPMGLNSFQISGGQ